MSDTISTATSCTAVVTPPIQSDIKILDNLLALNLTISLWTARRKLLPEDIGDANLPPEDLASLGSKRIADPETLKIFNALKSRAFSFLDRHGVRFMNGWAIPEDKAGLIIDELCRIREEFTQAKDAFLSKYEQTLDAWIARHAKWESMIRKSVASSDYVRSRLDFKWQLYKVQPLMVHESDSAVREAGLAEEVTGIANELFQEVARDANVMWQRVYLGKTSVTHKALSPLRTLRDKLQGLSFVEPHVLPVAEIIDAVLGRIPKRGNITGTDLLMLQGLVCLLRDGNSLLTQAEVVLDGCGTGDVLDTLLSGSTGDALPNDISPESGDLPEIIVPSTGQSKPVLASMGLW